MSKKYEPAGYLDAIIVLEIIPGTLEAIKAAIFKGLGETNSYNGNDKIFYKYRWIKDDAVHQAKFCKFAAGFPGALYVNFYYRGKPLPNFKERIYLK